MNPKAFFDIEHTKKENLTDLMQELTSIERDIDAVKGMEVSEEAKKTYIGRTSGTEKRSQGKNACLYRFVMREELKCTDNMKIRTNSNKNLPRQRKDLPKTQRMRIWHLMCMTLSRESTLLGKMMNMKVREFK